VCKDLRVPVASLAKRGRKDPKVIKVIQDPRVPRGRAVLWGPMVRKALKAMWALRAQPAQPVRKGILAWQVMSVPWDPWGRKVQRGQQGLLASKGSQARPVPKVSRVK
jgi:hypothetical protein